LRNVLNFAAQPHRKPASSKLIELIFAAMSEQVRHAKLGETEIAGSERPNEQRHFSKVGT
jgi:hypothetical protein